MKAAQGPFRARRPRAAFSPAKARESFESPEDLRREQESPEDHCRDEEPHLECMDEGYPNEISAIPRSR